MAKAPTDAVNLRLRLPEGLRQKLADEADKANRSLNSEILWRLTHTLGGKWEQFVAEAEKEEQRRQEVLEAMRLDPKVQETLTRLMADLRAGKFKEKAESRKKKEG
jgi:Arc-like DNA binding domain